MSPPINFAPDALRVGDKLRITPAFCESALKALRAQRLAAFNITVDGFNGLPDGSIEIRLKVTELEAVPR